MTGRGYKSQSALLGRPWYLFSDAFKHLRIDESERKCLAGRAFEGCFVSAVVLSGVRPDPLLWGRLASLTLRITSAVSMDSNFELQGYVDDLVLSVGGLQDQRVRVIIRTILRWLILGLKLAWRKGQRGSSCEWVCAYVHPWEERGSRGVIVGSTNARAVQLGQKCRALLKMGETFPKLEVRKLADYQRGWQGSCPR